LIFEVEYSHSRPSHLVLVKQSAITLILFTWQ